MKGPVAICGVIIGLLALAPVFADTTLDDSYEVYSLDPDGLLLDPPAMPNLDQFSAKAVAARLSVQPNARVSLTRMVHLTALDEFVGTDGRLAVWAARQTRNPVAIVIEEGDATLEQVAQQIAGPEFEALGDGRFIARVPILVGHGATLSIGESVDELRLSEQGGSFLVNDGLLVIHRSRLIAWDEAQNRPARLKNPSEFRPFLLSWGGAEMYIADSTIANLGYSASKSYGITISQYSPGTQEKVQRSAPHGWIVDSVIRNNWFGFYCYEAEDLVIAGNNFEDNHVYGIDPHDRSSGLIIAKNVVTGTRQKHGIIISREVNDSWLVDNQSSHNTLAGIMIDRQSRNNVIARNVVFSNGSDGIAVYESPDNLIWKNEVGANGAHGIRVRNSVNVKLYHNQIAANRYAGIYGHVRDLSATDRDTQRDPFATDISLVVVGGQLIHNGSGPIAIDQPLSIELFDVRMLAPNNSLGINLRGILGGHQQEILDLLVRQRRAVILKPVESVTQQASKG